MSCIVLSDQREKAEMIGLQPRDIWLLPQCLGQGSKELNLQLRNVSQFHRAMQSIHLFWFELFIAWLKHKLSKCKNCKNTQPPGALEGWNRLPQKNRGAWASKGSPLKMLTILEPKLIFTSLTSQTKVNSNLKLYWVAWEDEIPWGFHTPRGPELFASSGLIIYKETEDEAVRNKDKKMI